MKVLLRTRCGCTRITEAKGPKLHVALLPQLRAFNGEQPNSTGYTERVFVWRGVSELVNGEYLNVYEEQQ